MQGNITWEKCQIAICPPWFTLPFSTLLSALRKDYSHGVHALWLLIGFSQERASTRKERDGRYLFPQLHSCDMVLVWLFLFFKASQLRTALFFLVLGTHCSPGAIKLKESSGSAAAGPGFLNAPLWFSHAPAISLFTVCLFINNLLSYSKLTLLSISCWNFDWYSWKTVFQEDSHVVLKKYYQELG